jgi:tRNA nucleotidyltransferase (CCA-adding enzyme)
MKSTNITPPKGIQPVLEDIAKESGTSYLVGGAVIDHLQGREMKDWDIEVHGLPPSKLSDLVGKYANVSTVGQSFGVLKARIDGVDYDFSIPRKENSIGVGHKDFEVELASDLTPKEAAYRRDLTMNAMFLDLKDGIIVDPYNGLKDLEQGVLRHTGDQFAEDPLRVLRIMQLLPRKGKSVAPETIELCASMQDQFVHLPKERVINEWDKLLLKSNKPSPGLDFLIDSGWMQHFPELEVLQYTEQNPDWHPEGNVYNHTKMIIDNAAQLKHNLPKEWQRGFMYGTLLHDVGKAVTTDEELRSLGHDEAGVEIARRFLERMTNERELKQQTEKIVKYHMRPHSLHSSNAGEGAYRRLHNNIPLNVIAYVSRADGSARAGRSLDDPNPTSQACLDKFEVYGNTPEKIPPVLMGRHLIERGHAPGPQMGKVLKQAYNIQIDEGITSPQELYQRVAC